MAMTSARTRSVQKRRTVGACCRRPPRARVSVPRPCHPTAAARFWRRWYGVTCSSGDVTVLSLNANSLTGTIPTELALLDKLADIYLQGDGNTQSLTGALPTELGLLHATMNAKLNLGYNSFEGTVPTQYGRLSKLRELKIVGNSLTGTLPTEIGGLIKLETLTCQNNKLSGTLPPAMQDMVLLDDFLANSNPLSGTLPSQLGELTSLEIWKIGRTAVPRVQKWPLVAILNKGLSPLSPGPGLVAAVSIGTGRPEMSRRVPCATHSSRACSRLLLQSGAFSGTIPSELGQLSKLTTCQLYAGDRWTCPIPTEVTNIANAAASDVCNKDPELLCSCTPSPPPSPPPPSPPPPSPPPAPPVAEPA